MSRVGQPLQELVRTYRRRAGLTQREAAARARISTAGLRDLEQGRVLAPRPSTVRRLAAAFELGPAEAAELHHAARAEVAGLRVGVLGPLVVVVDGRTVAAESVVQRTLLALLAMEVNTPVSRDALIEAAWPTGPPPRAVDLLQTHVSRLRRRLRPRTAPPAVELVATPGGYQLTARDGQVDVLELRRLAGQARQVTRSGDLVTACDLYRRATDLWRGTPAADLPALQSHPVVVGLTREWRSLVVDHASAAAAIGRHQETLKQLQDLADSDPLDETVHAHLMIALAATGQQAAALDGYERLRRRLAEDLGADPGPELAAAHRRVLRQEFATRTDASVSARRQLPPDIADFTGRRVELRRLHDWLSAADVAPVASAVAIMSIEGMAGVGKTRLAVHLAHQLVAAGRYEDAQIYVDLRGHADQPPADPAVVLASLLRLLGVAGPGIPRDAEERATLYRHLLHDKSALVLLDNAADEEQVRPLLPAGPRNLVLTTSRRVLALDGARRLVLDVFTPDEATELLARIADPKRVADEAAAAREVARLCGELPIAVALAGHRLRARPTWRVADIAARLSEGNARLAELTAGTRRLQAVFDLSYEALPSDLAELFRLLGTHPGDHFTVRSAAALAGRREDVVRSMLDRLVDEHLLTATGQERYQFHDLLRDHARQLADRVDPPDRREAAAERLLWDSLVRTKDAVTRLDPARPWPKKLAVDDVRWFRDAADAEGFLAAERVNLMAIALDAADRAEPLARCGMWLAHSLFWFLYPRGHLQDLETLNHMVVRVSRRLGSPEEEAWGLLSLGILDMTQHRVDDAISKLRTAVAIAGRVGDLDTEQRALCNLANATSEAGRHDEATALLQRQLAIGRDIGDDVARLTGIANLGCVQRRLGNAGAALHRYREGLALATRVGDRRFTALLHHEIGRIHLDRNEFDLAHTHLSSALTWMRTGGGRFDQPPTLIGLSRVCRAQGRARDALGYCEEALAIAREMGDRRAELDALSEYADARRQM